MRFIDALKSDKKLEAFYIQFSTQSCENNIDKAECLKEFKLDPHSQESINTAKLRVLLLGLSNCTNYDLRSHWGKKQIAALDKLVHEVTCGE